jgi:hypothetical protein
MKVHEMGDFFHQNAVGPPTIKSIAGNTPWSGGEKLSHLAEQHPQKEAFISAV